MARRTIQDLIARYVLEPSLIDVYVEGRFDERVVRLFFKESGCVRPGVSIIDLVEIPDELLDRYQATRGEKAELIILAEELYRSLGNCPNFTAVVDSDFDRVFETVHENPLLLKTDFTCMEMYWVDAMTIERWFTWLGRPNLGMEDFVRDISGAAKELFLIRCAQTSLSTGAPMIPMRKYCAKTGCMLTLDLPRYCHSLLTSGGAAGRYTEVLAEVDRLKGLLSDDPRHWIHGHDLAHLIYVAYKDLLTGAGLNDVEAVATMIAMTIQIERLHEHPLFQKLLLRAC